VRLFLCNAWQHLASDGAQRPPVNLGKLATRKSRPGAGLFFLISSLHFKVSPRRFARQAKAAER
jgi:hypothetical protein